MSDDKIIEMIKDEISRQSMIIYCKSEFNDQLKKSFENAILVDDNIDHQML